MLNITEINIKQDAILSTLKDAPHTARLVEELIASHLEALAVMDKAATELWLAEDRGVVAISVKEIIAELERKS